MIEQNLENALENARAQIKSACDLYEWCRSDEDKFKIITKPKRFIEISIPVRMDDWKVEIFTWYRSQHNDARWPFKWWIRFR